MAFVFSLGHYNISFILPIHMHGTVFLEVAMVGSLCFHGLVRHSGILVALIYSFSQALPVLTEQLQQATEVNSPFHLPLLQVSYWCLKQLDLSSQVWSLCC